jgi:hypothetical protein
MITELMCLKMRVNMKALITLRVVLALGIFMAVSIPTASVFGQDEELPQDTAWFQATPSVVWCDPATNKMEPFKVEVHIVGLNGVSSVGLSNQFHLFDDGTHGDLNAGDNTWTADDVSPGCWFDQDGISTYMFQLYVTLDDNRTLTNGYLFSMGVVSSYYKDNFAVEDLGNGLSATKFAFFILDSNHEVMDQYPVANVYCGTSNFMAYKKLYSVLPDVFDMAIVTPGMQIFRPGEFSENVPYELTVKNDVRHIGMPITDRTAQFGSSGTLKSVIYHSFGDVSIMDHEMGHTWAAYLGSAWGLLGYDDASHWNEKTDIAGQMSRYYFTEDYQTIGHFMDNGDGTWKIIPNSTPEKYSQLELYAMGLIPPEQVPPIHVLSNIDASDPEHATATVVRTVTIDQIMESEGGPRIPAFPDTQKDFKVAFIVTSDVPYNDAAYAYFSILAYRLMSTQPPLEHSSYAPFYWATNGLGSLDVTLPVDVLDPERMPDKPTATPLPASTKTKAPTPTTWPTSTATITRLVETPTLENSGKGRIGICGLLPATIVIAPGIWLALKKRIRK